MEKIPLAEYVAIHGQTLTARQAGLTQSAIWQMLSAERQIYVTPISDDFVELSEIRKIKRRSAA